MFPINGRPLGPSGYGNLDLPKESRDLRCLTSAIMEAVAAMARMAKEEDIFVLSSMMKGVGEKEECGIFTPPYSESSPSAFWYLNFKC